MTERKRLALKWICRCPHRDRPAGQVIQFDEEVKPISIEKLIGLAKCLLSRLFGFVKPPEKATCALDR